MPAVNLVAEERTIKGSYVGTCVPVRDIPRYIDLFRGGRLPVDRLLPARLHSTISIAALIYCTKAKQSGKSCML